MSIVIVRDCISANLSHLPPGPAAGYTTGSPAIRWTDAQFASRPGAVHICQDDGSDETADVLDDETGAATDHNAAVWVPKAHAAYKAAKRPGQRSPAVYKSASGLTALVNTLIAAGIKSGVGLFVAAWSLDEQEAIQDVEKAAGPFPVIGVQYASRPLWDTSSFSKAWLDDVSVKAGTPHRHLTAAGDTVEKLAAVRGMDPAGWLALQERLGGKGTAAALAGGPLKAGLTWLSVNP